MRFAWTQIASGVGGRFRKQPNLGSEAGKAERRGRPRAVMFVYAEAETDCLLIPDHLGMT